MELKNIEVNNFRTIDHISVTPGKVNVIYGPNGSGKSSLLESVSFLLTGKAGTSVIKDGESAAEISAEVMGVPLFRKIGAKNSVRMNGKATTQKSVQQWIEESTGATSDALRVATSSGMLAAMNSKEFAEFLINNKLIPAEIDMDIVTMLCSVSPAAMEELEHMLPPAPCKFTMAEVEEAYRTAYATRPILKRQIAEKKIQSEYTGMAPTLTLKQIDAELASFSAYNAQLDAYNKLMQQYNAAIAKRKQAQALVADIDAKLRGASAKPVDENELAFLEAQKQKISTNILELSKKVQIIKSNLAMFTKTLENLDKPICPISEKLICTTDKTSIKEELTTLVEQNQGLLSDINEALEKETRKLSTFNDRIKDYNVRKQAFNNLEALIARRKIAEASIPDVPDIPVAPTIIPNSEERIAQLKDERRLIFAMEAAKNAAKELPALEAKLAVYDELVDLLCPKGGIREQIIAAAFEPLIEHCNERAKILKPDFKIDLVSGDGVRITCKPNGVSNMLPVDAVSAGEQLVVMLLLLDAINSLSNLGLLVLDDLDKLDADALDALFTMLQDPAVTAPYDHIFIAMVNHEDSMAIINKHKANINNIIDMAAI